MENKDLYFVAVKVFLVNKEEEFLILKDRFGDWDIPGGRLRNEDFSVPLESVIVRKMQEEVGEGVRYSLGDPIVFMRHERDEILQSGDRSKRRIFAVGYMAQYEAGEIVIGKNHERYEWVSVNNFKPEEKFSGGWLQGIKDFQVRYKEVLQKGDK